MNGCAGPWARSASPLRWNATGPTGWPARAALGDADVYPWCQAGSGLDFSHASALGLALGEDEDDPS